MIMGRIRRLLNSRSSSTVNARKSLWTRDESLEYINRIRNSKPSESGKPGPVDWFLFGFMFGVFTLAAALVLALVMK